MVEEKLISLLKYCFKEVQIISELSTSQAKINHAVNIISNLNMHPILSEYITYHPCRRAWCDRFSFTSEAYDLIHDQEHKTEKKAFDDGINYKSLPVAGLYFVGETHFNPITKEEFYWVKIGQSTNLKKRMDQYNTCCSMLWRIDFSPNYDDEKYYHDKLYNKCIATCNHNREWFMVDKDTYFEMCQKGFDYFNE